MGGHSGFIACSAALATSEVNFVLIPEISFTSEGENGFLEALERCIQQRGYALIVVAEGAGQELFDNTSFPSTRQPEPPYLTGSWKPWRSR
jgi:6-phosphofructokinase 1